MAAADSNQDIVGVVLNSLDGYLKSEGFESIEATVDGYEDPPTVMWKDGEEVYQPDIVAYKDESACVYEVEQCKDLEKDRVASKWKLMYRFAKKRNGEFCLIIPEEKKELVRQIVSELNIKASCLLVDGL